MNILKKFLNWIKSIKQNNIVSLEDDLSKILFDDNFRPGYNDFSYKNYQFDVFNIDEKEKRHLKTLKYKGKKAIKNNEDYISEIKIKNLFNDLAEEQRKEYVSQFNKIKIRKK